MYTIYIVYMYHRWFFFGGEEEKNLDLDFITSSLVQQEALSQLWNHFVHRLDDVLHLGKIP